MRIMYLVLVVFAATVLVQTHSYREWEGPVFSYDASGYYLYLPATFIYHDLGRLDFYPHLDSTIQPSRDGRWYAIYPQAATGRRLNKYPLGVALGELPFFWAARLYTWIAHADPEVDGYGLPYRYAICQAALVWSLLGLFFLGRFIYRFWGNATVAALTMALVGFGTNLYTYTITSFGLAHPLLFLLFSLLLYCTHSWHTTGRPRYLYGMALACGWIFLCRPPDIVVFLLPLVWGVRNRATLLQQGDALRRAGWHAAGAVLLFAALCGLQLGYWKWVTGHLFYYSYEGEHFKFADPAIWAGLFSWRKGWFIYTPLAFAGMLGLLVLARMRRSLALWLALYFAVTFYVVFSWGCWWYGWSFSCRALIESAAVLSVPLSAWLVWGRRWRWPLQALGGAAALFLVWLNIYQSNQFISQALPGDGITRAYYWDAWNKMHVSDETRKLLEAY